MKALPKQKLIRIATVPVSLNGLLKGQLSFLNQYYKVIAVSGKGKNLDEVEDREKVKTYPIEMQRRISPIKDLISLIKLYFYFKKEKPQIIHSITPKAGLLSMVAGYFAGVPIRIHTFTGLIFPTKKGKVQKLLIFMDRLLCRCATHIYPEGQGVLKDLVNYKITNKPLKVIANGNVNGIDASYFNPDLISKEQRHELRKSLGISEEDFVFIFVGRILRDKGINELVEAFSRLNKEFVNSKLLLVGPYDSRLNPLSSETIKTIRENPFIIEMGHQSDVRPYFAVSNALAFPSYREGFPNVVMQAGAMGLPSIVSDINGCNEIIIEGENGTIIPVKDLQAVYIAMKRMIMDNDYYIKLRNNARNMIISRYEQQVVWNAILEEYKKLEENV